MVTSGLASGRVSIQVAAIETRSLPSSLAAARRGFTFYLADPSARLTSIAKAVRVNRPYLTTCNQLFLVGGNLRQLGREEAFFFLVQRHTCRRDDLRGHEDDQVLFGVLFGIGAKRSAN